MRFLAGAMDDCIAYGPIWAFLIYTSMDPLDRLAHERTLHAALIWLPFYIWYLSYYTFSEGAWGAALGKSICGLRVVGKDRQPPGIRRALLRVLVYTLPWVLPSLILMTMVPSSELSAVTHPSEWATGREGSRFTDWAWVPLTISLFITMRRRNGYAALQDLASGTRVIVRPKAQKRPLLAAVPFPPRVPSAEPAGFGPYRASEVLWKAGEEELVLAFDPALQRKVWIHVRPLNAPPVSEARRDLSRAARLRWINRGRTETHAWDAYEAPDGQAFLSVVQTAQPWDAVRFWLLDLAGELTASLEFQETAPQLSLSRLWLTSAGHLIILDFTAPGLSGGVTHSETSQTLADAGTAQRFLGTVARMGLQGGTANSPDAAEPIPALVPVHARSFLSSLGRRAFEEGRFIVGNLKSLVAKPAEVSRSRRMVSLAFVPVLALLLGGSFAGIVSFDRIRWDRAWAAMARDLPSMRGAAEIYEYRTAHMTKGEPVPENVENMGTYIVAHYSEWITNAAFWASSAGKLLSSDHRRALEDAVAKFPEPSATQIAAAERSTPRRLAEYDKEQRQMVLQVMLGLFAVVPAVMGLIEVIGAAAFGISPSLRLFGIAAVNRHGLPAGRWHLIGRALVVWGVATVCGFLIAGLGMHLPEAKGAFERWFTMAVISGSASVMALAMIYAVIRPTAGLHDLMLRTRLVPV
jgi:uncharacterized RDD family membrane protein YckC